MPNFIVRLHTRTCTSEISSANAAVIPADVKRVSQLAGQVGRVGRRYGVSDPVDDVEDDEGERKCSSRHSVNVASAMFACFHVDRGRVRYFSR